MVWFLPEFDSPFYGGINTALRMADFLREHHGVENRFCFVSGPNEAWFRSTLRASFPGLADAKMAFHDGFTDSGFDEVIERLGHADCTIATIWHTAHTVAAYPGADRSFYLIQDFEPGFYPNGTLFALAEESYRLGLYGLCNSPTMGEIYAQRYGGVGRSFLPAVDRSVFHPAATAEGVGVNGDAVGGNSVDGRPLRVFLYARPGHWRNCFGSWPLPPLPRSRAVTLLRCTLSRRGPGRGPTIWTWGLNKRACSSTPPRGTCIGLAMWAWRSRFPSILRICRWS